MEQKFFIILLLFWFFLALGDAQFSNCDLTKSLAGGQTLTLNHLASYGTCRYLVKSPADTIIEASCKITTNCTQHIFLVSRAGQLDFSDAATYCGNGSPPSVVSIGNEIVVALNNQNYAPGAFSCTFTVKTPTDINCDCGWSVNTKIVGGSNTGVNEITSHAGLVNTNIKEIYCGATIISQYYSLTAAHCVDANPVISTVALLVGDWDVTTGTDTKWAKLYTVASLIKHSSYQATNNINDIALVRTTDYIRYNYGVGPACLPYTFNQYDLTGYFFTAVGWGTTSFAGSVSKILQKTDLKAISSSVCTQTYGSSIDSSKICTYGDGVRDTCAMDSGGGLYYQYSTGRRYIMAIVNYGTYCASKYPSVNSRVTYYISWIQGTTSKYNYCNKK